MKPNNLAEVLWMKPSLEGPRQATEATRAKPLAQLPCISPLVLSKMLAVDYQLNS